MLKKLILNRELYKSAYISFLLINIFPLISTTVVSRITLAVFVVWGIALLLTDLIKNRFDSYRNRAFWPMFLLFCFCGISCLINFRNGLLYNISSLGVTFLCVGILYITGKGNDPVKEAVLVGKCASIITAVSAFISIALYFFQAEFSVESRSGVTIHLGVWENRLFGIYSSCNVGGGILATGMILSLALWIYLKKTKQLTNLWKAVFLANILLGFWYISMTLSRGTYLAGMIATAVFGIFYCFPPAKSRAVNAAKKAVCILLILAVLWGGSYLIRMTTFQTISWMADQGWVELKVTGIDRIEYDEDDMNANADLTNKRASIWKSSLNLVRHKLLFGAANNYNEYLTNRDRLDWLTEEDITYIEWADGNLHNGYLQILVDGGILSLVSYLVFLVWCLIQNLRAYVRATRTEKIFLALCLALICFVLVNNFVETNMLLKGANPIQAIFWFTAGVDMTICHKIISRKTKEETIS